MSNKRTNKLFLSLSLALVLFISHFQGHALATEKLTDAREKAKTEYTLFLSRETLSEKVDKFRKNIISTDSTLTNTDEPKGPFFAGYMECQRNMVKN